MAEYIVDGGKTVDGINLNYDSMYVYDGGVVDETTVNCLGEMGVYNGGSANKTTVNSDGMMYVYEGGVANETTVNSDGILCVSNGGKAVGVTIASGGEFCCVNGSATEIDAEEGALLDLEVAPGYIAQGKSAGSSFEITDTVSGYTIRHGRLSVKQGGVANGVEVCADTELEIFSGGTATNVSVKEYGYVCFDVAPNTYVQGAFFDDAFETKDGQASNFTVRGTYTVIVLTGGTANALTVDCGKIYVYGGGVANNTTVKGGSMYVSNGGTANNTTINDGGGSMTLNNGTANSTTINAGGSMTVFDGGKASNTEVNAGGAFYVSEGGMAIATTVEKTGALIIYAGGVASDTTVTGSLVVYEGSVASDTTVNENGHLHVYGGKLTGKMTFEAGADAIAFTDNGCTVDFNLTQTAASADPLLNDFSFVTDEKLSFTLTVDGKQADGVYKLAGTVIRLTPGVFDGRGNVGNALGLRDRPYEGRFYGRNGIKGVFGLFLFTKGCSKCSLLGQ